MVGAAGGADPHRRGGADPINVFREEHDITEFSPARVKVDDRYVSRDSEETRAWKEYLPGSREAYLASMSSTMSDDKRAQADGYSSDRRNRPGAVIAQRNP